MSRGVALMGSAEALAAALEPVLRDSEEHFRKLAEALPAPIYTTDATGWITSHTSAAAAFWGRDPIPGASRWSGAWKLYRLDGTPLPFEQSSIAIALKERRPVQAFEAIAERPDGTR